MFSLFRNCVKLCVYVVLFPAFGAVLQGSLFGMAGLLPASYTTPIMSGQGLAGTFAAFAMICAIASESLITQKHHFNEKTSKSYMH